MKHILLFEAFTIDDLTIEQLNYLDKVVTGGTWK